MCESILRMATSIRVASARSHFAALVSHSSCPSIATRASESILRHRVVCQKKARPAGSGGAGDSGRLESPARALGAAVLVARTAAAGGALGEADLGRADGGLANSATSESRRRVAYRHATPRAPSSEMGVRLPCAGVTLARVPVLAHACV